jgi:hypothetical protein
MHVNLHRGLAASLFYIDSNQHRLDKGYVGNLLLVSCNSNPGQEQPDVFLLAPPVGPRSSDAPMLLASCRCFKLPSFDSSKKEQPI